VRNDGIAGLQGDPSFATLRKEIENLDFARKKLVLAESVDQEFAAAVIADALSGVVSAFDGFGRELCSDWDARASFQNLDGGRKRVQQGFNFDMADCLTVDEWHSACRSFQKRHLLAHKMGVIDEEYVQKTGDPMAVVGRKITLATDEVASLIGMVEKVGKRLYEGVMTMPRQQTGSTPEIGSSS